MGANGTVSATGERAETQDLKANCKASRMIETLQNRESGTGSFRCYDELLMRTVTSICWSVSKKDQEKRGSAGPRFFLVWGSPHLLSGLSEICLVAENIREIALLGNIESFESLSDRCING